MLAQLGSFVSNTTKASIVLPLLQWQFVWTGHSFYFCSCIYDQPCRSLAQHHQLSSARYPRKSCHLLLCYFSTSSEPCHISFKSSELNHVTSSSSNALNAHVTQISFTRTRTTFFQIISNDHKAITVCLMLTIMLSVVRIKCFPWLIRHLLLRNVWQYIEIVFSLCGPNLCSKQEEHCTKDCTPGYGYFSSFNHMHMACMQVKR